MSCGKILVDRSLVGHLAGDATGISRDELSVCFGRVEEDMLANL
jgi:hypothetical protein